MQKIGFIGAGKCGVSLAKYFSYKGYTISGFYSRQTKRSDFSNLSCEALAKHSDVIFITVTDDAVSEVWNRLCKYNLSGKVICHTSGSLSSDIFSGADKAFVCSVHPILAFNTDNTPISDIEKAAFTLEGGSGAMAVISEILSNTGNAFKIINKSDKAKYHAAAVFASNFVVAVCDIAKRLLSECGFSQDEAHKALSPLMENNMKNILLSGTQNAITGPAARGDIKTIERHLSVIGEYETLYIELTKVIYEMKGKQYENDNSPF